MRRQAMGTALKTWITVLAAVIPLLGTLDAKTVTKKAALDPGTVQVLSSILESLDAFRNDRLRDLEKIRLTAPVANGTSDGRTNVTSYLAPKNSSISEHIQALKDGIMGHNPVKKTFGYKVTVYTTPVENGKEQKPVLVTQYVGGDMLPDEKGNDVDRKGDVHFEDLQESANHPQMVVSSESVSIPVHAVHGAAGARDTAQAGAAGASSDHHRKTEHYAASDKGHSNAHSLKSKSEKGHDKEKHSAKHDEHHKEVEKESHRHDEQAHDKGGATQQGIKERTEIEYYEREHFLDTEYDKAKTGHENTKGLKEHESHNDHDSHEHKKVHAKEDSTGHKLAKGALVDKTHGTALQDEAHVVNSGLLYTPPYGIHHHQLPHHAKVDQAGYKEGHQGHDEGHEGSKLHLSEEDKGHKEHNHEKDLHSEQKDSGYQDKDRGRRKEGYRERGYKITAEREYFLNDAHHDKGHATHSSGSRLKDQEGAAHGSKEGERDRGFVKEEKEEEAHDAAYDAKERKYFDGEQHKEEVQEEKSEVASVKQKDRQEELLPVVPAGVNYVDPHHHVPVYPHPHPLPIAYAPSDDGAQALLALPPDDLKKISKSTPHAQRLNDRKRGTEGPVGGYDDDDYADDPDDAGYVGHAGYRKRPGSSGLVASIKDGVRKDVHRTYSKPKAQDDESVEDNSVRFPDEKGRREKGDSDESGEYVEFPRGGDEDERRPERGGGPPTRTGEDDRSYPAPKNEREQDLINLHEEHLRKLEREKAHRNAHDNRDLYYTGHRGREPQRYSDPQPQGVYTPGIQRPDKLLRTIDHSSYPQAEGGKLPTVREILEEVSRFPQRKPDNQYHEKTQDARTQQQQPFQPGLQQYYNIGPEAYAAQRQRGGAQQVVNVHDPRQQQGHIGSPHHQRTLSPMEQLHQQQRQLQELQQQQFRDQQRNGHQPRGVTPLQQQTKPPFSPVVLLSRGPPPQPQNQAVGIWYTRQ